MQIYNLKLSQIKQWNLKGEILSYRLLRHSLRSFLAMTKIVKLQICLIMDCRDSASAESRNDEIPPYKVSQK
ncbi:MAG: hypothetical protein K2G68_06255 [Helicobacter sp.]|uniref:hypothetical protein n=1 Tax=uncultured Helicobacter sp. TaxID=175537 RepID=UPI0023C2F1F4|nr:hypothetical protein [uncultured Helicobacter sp.]MDE5926296.1 hypothetical protein [Helicobacter sp.]